MEVPNVVVSDGSDRKIGQGCGVFRGSVWTLRSDCRGNRVLICGALGLDCHCNWAVTRLRGDDVYRQSPAFWASQFRLDYPYLSLPNYQLPISRVTATEILRLSARPCHTSVVA